eukprot:COSAG05_NODE_93_length_19581_cov_53.686685_15_plen_116_part_00
MQFTITALGGGKSLDTGDVIVQETTNAVGVVDSGIADDATKLTLRVVTGTFSKDDKLARKSDGEEITTSAITGAAPDDGAQIQATPHRFANALAMQKPLSTYLLIAAVIHIILHG